MPRASASHTSSTASGSVDYAAGLATLTDYVVGAAPGTVTLQSLWTRRAAWNTASVFFRTQAAPLKPEGLVLTLVDLSGNALTVTSAADGTLSGDHARGKIDYEGGTAELQFGDYVDDATLTAAQKAEWWYSAADVGAVQAGKIWRPLPVDPSTLRYNSVAYFYLPLDADILGIDPVRLPPDGRVPIFRVGGFVVVGHTGTVPAATYSNGQTINCARTRLSRVYLIGADGKLIRSGYTVDLDAGLITVVDVSTWVQPVTVRHRIEEMTRVADLQIDGTLRFTSQLSHDFPVGSVVSSALMAGNLRARALPVWDQLNWDGVTWLDAVAARARGSAGVTQTLAGIQHKLIGHGFLLLNASLVFRPHVAPAKDAKAWLPFFETVIAALAQSQPALILWGKIAEQLNRLPVVQALPQIVAEHPYNLSFIGNREMHALFGPLRLLHA
eukprot:gene31667-39118_t